MTQRYSVILTRDDSYIWPWRASVTDTIWNQEIGFGRGKSADIAIVMLKSKLTAAGKYNEGVALAFESVTIEYDRGNTVITATTGDNYPVGMSDDNVTPDRDHNDNPIPAPACAKCHIISAKYPNGDPTQIEPHLNRYGIKQLLCFTCRLEEHLAKLKADKRLTAGMADNNAPWPFERWLGVGDMIRAHSLGVELVGHLPTMTPQTIEECKRDMERTYF